MKGYNVAGLRVKPGGQRRWTVGRAEQVGRVSHVEAGEASGASEASNAGPACDDRPMSSSSPQDAGVSETSREELIRALRMGRITLVDVLSPESFAAMHIPGAINLPVVDIARRAGDVLPDRRAPIVAYCGGPA